MKKWMVGVVILALLAGGASGVAASGGNATDSVRGMVAARSLNVRGGPGTDHPVVGGLSRGDVVEVVGKNAAADWLQITYPKAAGGRAWVAGAFVDGFGDVAGVPQTAGELP